MSGPASSAVQLADLALAGHAGDGLLDLVMIDDDLASDRGLETAMGLSLAIERRAEPDDVPPSGDANDRRGWWADQFSEVEGDKIGSRLWLLDRSKSSSEIALRAEEYVREALAWMIEDRVVTSLDVQVQFDGAAILIAVSPQRPGRDPVTFRFAHAWAGQES